jgi:dTDP-4-dehydrorhamnose reductase
MKTIVVGSAGQLGRDIVPLWPGEVIAITRPEADLTNPVALREELASHRPDFVVNCAAYNFVDRAESEPETAFAVNAWGARQLALICRQLDATLVHFSTDYVFGADERRREPWQETDAPGPISAYGLSKLTGEHWVRLLCPKHFVIRTCGLFGVAGSGGKGGNFVESMLRLATQGRPISVVDDQHCTPSFTRDVAAASAALVATGVYGLYHITNAGDCSWYEFAREIFRQSDLHAQLKAITSAEFGAVARRPAYSVLARAALDSLGMPPMRSWREALGDYLRLRGKRAPDASIP